MTKIHLIEVDDWIAVYGDGKKVWENHSCPLAAGLEALGIEFTQERPDEDDPLYNADNADNAYDYFPEELTP